MAALVWNEAGKSALSLVELSGAEQDRRWPIPGWGGEAASPPAATSAPPASAPQSGFGVGIARSAAASPDAGESAPVAELAPTEIHDLPAEIVGGIVFAKRGSAARPDHVRRGHPARRLAPRREPACASCASPRARIPASISKHW